MVRDPGTGRIVLVVNPIFAPLLYGIFILIGGLVVCALRDRAGSTLAPILRVVGIVIVIVGLLLIVLRPLVWIARHLEDMMGA